MPSFGGAAIFGRGVSMATQDNPLERQENAFPGLDGVESLTLGQRGRFTVVTGVLFGALASDLESAEATFRSYNDGVARTLVDSYGGSWDYALLETFEPQGRIFQDGYYGYGRRYVARFRHLV